MPKTLVRVGNDGSMLRLATSTEFSKSIQLVQAVFSTWVTALVTSSSPAKRTTEIFLPGLRGSSWSSR